MRRGTIGLALLMATLLGTTHAVAADHASPAVTASRDARVALPEEESDDSRYSSDWIALEGKGSTAMLRSLPVAEGVDFGVGLFAVVGASEKELVRRRTDPAPEVRSRDRRVPAVGMSLRF